MVANLKNNSYDHAKGLKRKILIAYAAMFIIIDVIYNYTYGAMLFIEFADNDRKTLTARLKHYLRTQPETWRGKLAFFMCRYMIEPWDWNHCGLSKN